MSEATPQAVTVKAGMRLRAYPTAEQKFVLDQWMTVCGMFWNDLVGWWWDAVDHTNGTDPTTPNPRRSLSRVADVTKPDGHVVEGLPVWSLVRGGRRAPTPFRNHVSGRLTLEAWPRPGWLEHRVPVKMLHGVGQDFDQAVALWWSKQRDHAAVQAWKSRRLKRGLKPRAKWKFSAPRTQRASERGNLRWQEQGAPFSPLIGRDGQPVRRRRAMRVVGFTELKLGDLVVAVDPGLPLDGKVKSIRISRDKMGHYWVGVSLEVPKPAVVPARIDVVGLDRGVKVPVAASRVADLTAIPGLKPGERRRLRQLENKIARIHRQLSPECHAPGARCTGQCGFGRAIYEKVDGRIQRDDNGQPVVRRNSRGVEMKPSNNLIKLRHQVAKLKQREQRRRQQARHTFTSMVTTRCDTIAVEDLHTQQMTRSASGNSETPGTNVSAKSGLNRSILAVGWHEIARQLNYKAGWKSRTVIAVSAHHTSQRCPKCAHTSPDNRQNQADFKCVMCGHTDNADHNAAVNIEQSARQHM